MSTVDRIVEWMIVEYVINGNLGIVNVKDVISRELLNDNDLSTGKLITVFKKYKFYFVGVKAKIVMSSDDKLFLESQLKSMATVNNDDANSHHSEETLKDYSGSESSWKSANEDLDSSDSNISIPRKINRKKIVRSLGKSSRPFELQSDNLITLCDAAEQVFLPNEKPRELLERKSPDIDFGFDQETQTSLDYRSMMSKLDNLLNGIYRFGYAIKDLGHDYEDIERYEESCKQKKQKMTNESHPEECLPILTAKSSTDDDNTIVEYVNEIKNPNTSIDNEIEAINIEATPGFLNCIHEIDLMIDNIINTQSDCSLSNEDSIIENNNFTKQLLIAENMCSTPKRRSTIESKWAKSKKHPLVENKSFRSKENSIIENTKSDNNVSTPNAGKRQTIENDMVAIGSGLTKIPRSLYEDINWKCYTAATRKLLRAVFPRRVLATHSRTGKPSPAFQNKPPKMCLDKQPVDDIVMTVVKKCKVKPNLVKQAITIKLADENKMWRMKENKFKK